MPHEVHERSAQAVLCELLNTCMLLKKDATPLSFIQAK